jgi:hypothetical protein
MGGLMRRSLAISALAGTCLAVVVACSNSPEKSKASDERVGFVPCQEPRPEACTMRYDPVCGALEGGGRKTYSNACVACSDSAVMVYSEGACADHAGQETPK